MSAAGLQSPPSEPLIISRNEQGFRVYSAAAPDQIFQVSGGPDFAVCSCPEFQESQGWGCDHVDAVLRKTKAGSGEAKTSKLATLEKPARSNPIRRPKTAAVESEGISQMLIKRSVSPDGRIDSLSIEFSCPVQNASADDIRSRAVDALKLQSEISSAFRAANSNGHGHAKPAADNSTQDNGHGQLARLLRIGGMDGRYGRRLFITVQVNGDRLRLFGSKKELARAIEVAGFPERAKKVDEDLELNLPCRVTTEPSTDGKYVNVKEVMPASSGAEHRS